MSRVVFESFRKGNRTGLLLPSVLMPGGLLARYRVGYGIVTAAMFRYDRYWARGSATA